MAADASRGEMVQSMTPPSRTEGPPVDLPTQLRVEAVVGVPTTVKLNALVKRVPPSMRGRT